jgi:hypothetical protein
MKSIKRLSTIVLSVMAPFVLFYSFKGLFWAYDNSFGDASWWVTGGWAAEGANITTAMKAAYFTAWSLPVFAGVAGFLVAIRILWGLRQGRVFEITVANGLRLIGIAVFLSSALHMGAACVSPMIQSWNNPGGAEPLRFWYSHAYIGLLFCGFGFWMMGQVMTLAITAVRENEEFV